MSVDLAGGATGALSGATAGATFGAPGAVIGGIIGGAAGLFGGGGDSEKALEDQADAARRMSKIAKEQWRTYQSTIFPLEQKAREMGITAQELALQRGQTDADLYQNYYAPLQEKYVGSALEGIKPQYDKVAKDARLGVDRSFDAEQGILQRNLARHGVTPGSGEYTGSLERGGLARASALADAQNTARENERNRVEDTNFNRMGTVLGRMPVGSNPSQSLPQSNFPSMYGMNAAANQFGNVSQAYGQNAMGAQSAGVQLGQAGAQLYDQFANSGIGQSIGNTVSGWFGGGSSTPAAPSTSANGAGAIDMSGVNLYGGGSGAGYREGGEIAPGDGREAGLIRGPAGNDQVPGRIHGADGNTYEARFTDGEYVIPPEVVMDKGTDFFDQLIRKSREKRQTQLRRAH
jgi:hypothetical protein